MEVEVRYAAEERGRGFTCRAVVVLLHRLPSAVLSRDPRMRTSLVLSDTSPTTLFHNKRKANRRRFYYLDLLSQ